jgi:hydroxyacylglutathione hydrolase
MIIRNIVVGALETNCYVVGDESTKEAFVIDPGADYEQIKKVIDEEGLKPKAVINTHGHGDHIIANGEFNVPVWIHSLDADFLGDPSKNLSGAFGMMFKTKPAQRLLQHGDMLLLGDHNFQVIHTPGHTPGSICLKGGDVIFSGDTLFYESVGRTDFAYGSEKDIMRAIKERLFALDDKYVVYPGHGPVTSIEHEKKHNPFIEN